MADPAVQAYAAQQFPIIHDAVYAVLAAHPDSPTVLDLKDKLDAFYTGAVDVLGIEVAQQRDGGHKPPPTGGDDPEEPSPGG